VTKNPNSDQSYTLDLPVTTLVTEASIEKPNLGIGLAIDSLLLNDLLKRFTMPESIEATHVVRGVSVSTASSELLDATLRLMKLLERPNEIPALAPLITQEILYRLLSGSDGPRLLSIALSDSHGNRIAKALTWLRENFSKPLRIEELAERVGMPKGVLNIITGQPEVVGGVLTASPVVRKLSFTGSTEVGRLLLRQCAGTVKKVSLELGGNAPFIIFADADLDRAVAGVMISKFRNGGQTCVCANRIFVEDTIYDAFTSRLQDAVKALVVGNGMTAGTTIGPLIDQAAVDKVEDHISDAVNKGAKISLGGKRHALGGTFFEPTILLDVPGGTKLMNEETFGPVAPLTRFSTEQEVIAMSNDTEFGLAAYFYTRDIGRVWRVAEALEYGIVGINEGLISTEVAPFGGVKQSGIGREGSKYGIEEYVEVKYLCMGGV